LIHCINIVKDTVQVHFGPVVVSKNIGIGRFQISYFISRAEPEPRYISLLSKPDMITFRAFNTPHGCLGVKLQLICLADLGHIVSLLAFGADVSDNFGRILFV
jgi:hypothetical protein